MVQLSIYLSCMNITTVYFHSPLPSNEQIFYVGNYAECFNYKCTIILIVHEQQIKLMCKAVFKVNKGVMAMADCLMIIKHSQN